MTVDLLSLWNKYKDIAWENTTHKKTCESYVLEMQEIIAAKCIKDIDDAMIDTFRSEFRRRGNRNSTINRKISCVGKLLRREARTQPPEAAGPVQVPRTQRPGAVPFTRRGKASFLVPQE